MQPPSHVTAQGQACHACRAHSKHPNVTGQDKMSDYIIAQKAN